jgi:hypothetical protein
VPQNQQAEGKDALRCTENGKLPEVFCAGNELEHGEWKEIFEVEEDDNVHPELVKRKCMGEVGQRGFLAIELVDFDNA